MAWSTNKESGFTLLEVLVAIALMLVLVVGNLSANTLATTTIGLNKRRSEANRLAREGMEAVESIRAANFDSLATGDYYPVLTQAGWSLVSGSQQSGDFTRTITISNVLRSLACLSSICDIVQAGGVVDLESFYVDVKVDWQEAGTNKEVKLSNLVTNWR